MHRLNLSGPHGLSQALTDPRPPTPLARRAPAEPSGREPGDRLTSAHAESTTL